MITRFLALALLALLFADPAAAERRLALVIGNGAYAEGPLANPASDARLTSGALKEAGFEVATVIDADQRAMKEAVRAFADRLKQAGSGASAFFYFAGHGVQVNGRNYLMPVGASVGAAADLEFETVEAQWVLDLIGEAGAGVSIFVLDACRNNPFRSLSRSASRGLARMDAPRGSILSYSTAPGEVALDGAGGNSPYTAALAQAIATPGLKIEEAFKAVRRSVVTATRGKQTPWESSSLIGDFFFTPGAGGDGGGGVQLALAPGGGSVVRAAGSTFRDCPDCPELVAIAGGRTTIGSAAGEPHESPPTAVNVRPFAIGRTEVTRGQFADFLAATGRSAPQGCWHYALVWLYDGARSWRNPGYAQTDDHPVVCVRWADAKAYADWLAQKTGEPYRLPSEAEWEHAAGPEPWGGDGAGACAYGNVHDATANAAFGSGAVFAVVPCDDGAATTTPVSRYRANGNKLADMWGNAMEWTEDCWNASHAGRPGDGGPRRDGDCGSRPAKGSNFGNYGSSFRTAYRLKSIAKDPNVYLGFRVARDLR